MHRQSAILILGLSLCCGYVDAAEQSSKPDYAIKTQSITKTSVDSDEAFLKALSAMETKNQGADVEANFKRFLENPDKYLSLLTKKYLFNVEHSPAWRNEFGAAAEYAKKNDWKSCRLAATMGLNYKADEPVLFFLRAIAHKKLNENELSIADLEGLYTVKSQRKDIQDHNKYYESEERDFFNFLLI